MSKLKHITAGMVAIALSAGMWSCNGNRQSVKQPATEQRVTSADPFENMLMGYKEWESMRVPVTLRVRTDKNLSISGTATMVRNKSVALSLKFFGMEIGQLHVSEDSIVVVDKVNKQYMVQPIGSALGGFDVNVANLQDLLTGRAFLLGTEQLTAQSKKDFEISDTNGNVKMTPRKQPSGVSYEFMMDGQSGNVSLLSVTIPGHDQATCSYTDVANTDVGNMAGAAMLAVVLKDKPLSVEFDWNFGKARWNDPADSKEITIPSNYTRMNASEIIKQAQKSL